MKKTKKLGFAVFGLLLSLALSATSTYAWFTRAGTPEINSFKMEAMADTPALLISLNQSDTEETWKNDTASFRNTWTTAQITGALGTILDKKLGAFTSTNGSTFKNEAMEDRNAVNNEYTNEGTIISFKVRFRAETALSVALATGSALTANINPSPKPVYAWSDFGSGTTPTAASFSMKKGGQNGAAVTSLAKNDEIYLSSAYAARLSFENETLAAEQIAWQNGYIAWVIDQLNTADSLSKTDLEEADYIAAESPATKPLVNNSALVVWNNGYIAWLTGQKVTADVTVGTYGTAMSAASAKIWNPQATNSITDTKTASNYYVIADSATNNFAVAYKNSFAGGTTPITSTAPAAHINTLNSGTDGVELNTLTKDGSYYYGSLTVRIWLEGWDTSCTNTILGDTFTTLLKFSAKTA